MKKIIFFLILVALFISTTLIITLSTIGIETNRFNNLISKKINQINSNVNLKLNLIKFKIDISEISLFLDTLNPKINYRDELIPVKSVKVYIDFKSIIGSNAKIKKINLVLEELDINQLKKLSTTIKPSNFKSILNNKIKQGKIISEFEFYLDNNVLENFIAKGSVVNLKMEITKNLNLEKINFNFFADKTDVLIQNIFGETDFAKIIDGDLKLILSPEILLKANFKTNLKFDKKNSLSLKNSIKKFKFANDIVDLEADLSNNLSISFDKTYKVKKYQYKNTGKILKANFNFKKPKMNYFFNEKINRLILVNSEIKTNFNPKNNNIIISGKYSKNNEDLLAFDLDNNFNKKLLNLRLNFEYNKDLKFDLINYQKPTGSIANFSLNLDKKKNNINIKKLKLTEKNNLIIIEDLKFNKKNFLSLKKISVKTNKNGIKNNDFSVLFGKDILVKGFQFDASNLPKILKQTNNNNNISQISKNIEIEFKNVIAPLSENLKNFKLIGKIEKGKFTKISSKGDFGDSNFLDISMRSDKKNKKKYLEIYSDLTHPLLTEFSFFKGLTGGKLLYTSILDADNSSSKLRIENFKVINAPGMVKLLSLADLGGLADLAEGEGLSFDLLEINMEKSQDYLKLNEILALGPSVSVLMEGYQDQNNLTSLRGTLVPAKTLNKMISKIPVIGNIIIPKEVGEGLFGISFKMKGSPGNIKTTINPIRTLTPRFIQKIVDRNKKLK